MGEARVVTIEEANALVPRLSLLVGRQLARASEIEQRIERLRARGGQPRPLDLEVAVGDPEEVRDLKRDLTERIETYDAGWREVEELGAVIKDPRTGLVDFYGRVEGRIVWLCWRFGEEAVAFYHELDTGFTARKPLSPSLRKHMLN